MQIHCHQQPATTIPFHYMDVNLALAKNKENPVFVQTTPDRYKLHIFLQRVEIQKTIEACIDSADKIPVSIHIFTDYFDMLEQTQFIFFIEFT